MSTNAIMTEAQNALQNAPLHPHTTERRFLTAYELAAKVEESLQLPHDPQRARTISRELSSKVNECAANSQPCNIERVYINLSDCFDVAFDGHKVTARHLTAYRWVG